MEKEQLYKGKVSFINYEKGFATIDYLSGVKQKTVNFKINVDIAGKKPHQFRLGDAVSFQLKLSDRGDKMTAVNVKYLHNTAVNLLVQKAAIENRFSGYLKKVEDKYFVKEWETYISFPLQLSPWEVPPAETAENEAISFRLINLEKPNAILAELFSHNFISAYRMALQFFEKEKEVDAIVTKITPHSIYLGLFNEKIQAKLPITELTDESDGYRIKEGDKLPVLITYLTSTKIAVKKAGA
jgi:S1 RNA binding domain